MELAMGGLMDNCGNRLHLAHAGTNGDPLLLRGKVAVHIGIHRLKLDGNRGRAPQGFHENLKVLHIPRQVGGQFRQRLSVRLTQIKNFHRAEHGNLNFLFLGDDFPVLIQNRSLGIWVQLLFLDFLFIWRGRDYGNAMLTLFHMALKLIFPLVEASDQRSIRLLHIDEHGVIDRIAVETGHHRQVTHILLALEQLLDTLFDALGDFPQSLPVGWFIIRHGNSTPSH